MRVLAAICLCVPIFGVAIDHSNLDFGRPLRIEDGHPLALGEMALEFGSVAGVRTRGGVSWSFEANYLYGFAPGMHVEVGAGATIEESQVESVGHMSLLLGITRETASAPASAVRFDAQFGRSSTSLSAKGILSGQFGEYGKWHLNGDMIYRPDPTAGERRTAFAGAIGYSFPLGLPRDFTQTIVAAFNLSQSAMTGEGMIGSVGIGLRKQIGIREVLDLGIETDLFATNGAPRQVIRLNLGFSNSF